MQEILAQTYTVLLVDNDARSNAAVAASLRRAGYHIRAYDRAETLLEDLDQVTPPACVIAEFELPGMNGIELSLQLNQRMPVIILTATGDVATAVRALRGNVADYLVKPYVERDLIMRLQLVLRRHAEAACN
jgi:two-component system response regulator FixJ